MVRIHLCQIWYNPAYFDASSDFLQEPAPSMDTKSTIGQLRHIEQIADFLLESRAVYVNHIIKKLCEITLWSKSRGANIVAFPEYSVPCEALPPLQNIAKQNGIFIVAGTHRVRLTEISLDIYESLGLDTSKIKNGTAVAPIIYPDTGIINLSSKTSRSKWEPDLDVSAQIDDIHEVKINDMRLRVAVFPCIDALQLGIFYSWDNNGNKPHILICPSLSPTVNLFTNVGNLLAANEILFAFVNSAEFGGTGFNIPKEWEPYVTGVGSPNKCINACCEAILELDVDADSFFLKKGSVKTKAPCNAARRFPIVYFSTGNWIDKYLELSKDILELLNSNDSVGAIEWVDNFLSDQVTPVPEEIISNLHELRYGPLVLFSGNVDDIRDSLQLAILPKELDDSRLFFAERIARLIKLITSILQSSTGEDTALLISYLRILKVGQERFSLEIFSQEATARIVSRSTEENLAEFVHRPQELSVASFQNRGASLDSLRDIVTRGSAKVIMITGMSGIGKTELVKTLFVKVLTDWKPIWIDIANGSSLARVAAAMGRTLGLTMDIDALSTSTDKIFRGKMTKLFDTFFGVEKHALILDDLRDLRANVRDYNQLHALIEIASEPKRFKGSRIFIISSIAATPIWMKKAGIERIHLKGLDETYIKRVIEYQLRSSELISSEAMPSIPQMLLDIIEGHPLAAKLAVEGSRKTGIAKLGEEDLLTYLSTNIIDSLLSKVELSSEEEWVIQVLSLLRLPVKVSDIALSLNAKIIGKLAARGIVDFDGYSYSIHQIIRRFFSACLHGQKLMEAHAIAADLYRRIDKQNKLGGNRDINIVAELAHHLSFAGDTPELRALRINIFEEIYPVARVLYGQKDYDKALSMFRLLAECRPNDPAIWAYIGRCYGRRGQWEDSDNAFKKAIDVASATKQPTWWIHRDWGHIRARFGFYTAAQEHLDEAKDLGGKQDPSCIAADAYVKWRTGAPDTATKEFEYLIKHHQYHGYTLKTYSMLLEENGENERAEELRKRLELIESEMIPPLLYDMEVESDPDE
jgi:tetratricopeptide (TPR) repeat protein